MTRHLDLPEEIDASSRDEPGARPAGEAAAYGAYGTSETATGRSLRLWGGEEGGHTPVLKHLGREAPWSCSTGDNPRPRTARGGMSPLLAAASCPTFAPAHRLQLQSWRPRLLAH